MSDCDCTKTPTSDEYLMIAATAENAGQCGTPAASANASCDKQEKMFDESLSAFLIPATNASVSMQVCNAKVYSVGMWIEFLNPFCILQISAITGNILSLVNRCPDGSSLAGNPEVSTAIGVGSLFVVAARPACDVDYQDELAAAMADMTELCVPDLLAHSNTAIIHPVGRLESDPENTGAAKCIKRIFGILFKAGRPFLSAMGAPVSISDLHLYRRIVRNTSTGGLHLAKNYFEQNDVTANNRYGLSIDSARERVIGPIHFCQMWHMLVKENTSNDDPDTWPSFTNSRDEDFDLGGYDRIQLIDNVRDHYYVMVRFELGAKRSGALVSVNAKLNDKNVCRVFASSSGSVTQQYNSVTVPVKVMKSDDKITLKLTTDGTVKFQYSLHIEAIYM